MHVVDNNESGRKMPIVSWQQRNLSLKWKEIGQQASHHNLELKATFE